MTTAPVAIRPSPTRTPRARSSQGSLQPAYRTVTLAAVALVSLTAFESLAITTAMPGIARSLDGLSMYARRASLA
jgi:hypothetical protein